MLKPLPTLTIAVEKFESGLLPTDKLQYAHQIIKT